MTGKFHFIYFVFYKFLNGGWYLLLYRSNIVWSYIVWSSGSKAFFFIINDKNSSYYSFLLNILKRITENRLYKCWC